ncbi:MAG: hypothetical protein M5U34_15195 [Chloroflexi bacterium]|nr:hypothetical protein [Chloroflexota bacterium]
MQQLLPVSELLQELAGFASAVSAALEGENVDWHWRPAPGEWSPHGSVLPFARCGARSASSSL